MYARFQRVVVLAGIDQCDIAMFAAAAADTARSALAAVDQREQTEAAQTERKRQARPGEAASRNDAL